MILLENNEISATIAALRFYQREMTEGLYPYTNDDEYYWMLEIATDGGTHEALDTEGIDELVEKLQGFRRL
ncbi:MAG: hypothetical protein ACYSW3_02120 [Planctomycetota bacterium]|jgi:hypothetical protein